MMYILTERYIRKTQEITGGISLPIGLITRGVGGSYNVVVGNDIYECKPRGIFRKKGIVPLPGDNVEISILDNEDYIGVIEKISERTSCLIRPSIANANKLVVVISAASPKPDLMLLDKLLIMGEKSEIEPIICVNKIDIDNDDVFKNVYDIYSKKCGYDVMAICAKTEIGIPELAKMLRQGLVVFAGQSGVGKSTILNVIFESEVMKTGVVSSKIQRGKHTTRHVELLDLPGGGYIADTPGFTSFDITDITIDELQLYYPDYTDKTESCRFKGCRHLEEPGCAIKTAVKNGEIDKGRYDRYVALCTVLKDIKSYETKHEKYSDTKGKK